MKPWPLNEVDPSFIEIEHMFCESDRKKYGISLSNKTVANSSIIKNYATNKSFSLETIDNFKKLFEKLTNR